MLTQEDTREFRLSDSEGTSVDKGAIGFRIPGIDVAGTTSHPQQNDTFARRGTLRRTLGSPFKKSRQAESCHARESRFEEVSSRGEAQAFTNSGKEGREGGERQALARVRRLHGRASISILWRAAEV
jgi:hypothetical protein